MMSQGGIRVVSNLGEDGESDVSQLRGREEDIKNPITNVQSGKGESEIHEIVHNITIIYH